MCCVFIAPPQESIVTACSPSNQPPSCYYQGIFDDDADGRVGRGYDEGEVVQMVLRGRWFVFLRPLAVCCCSLFLSMRLFRQRKAQPSDGVLTFELSNSITKNKHRREYCGPSGSGLLRPQQTGGSARFVENFHILLLFLDQNPNKAPWAAGSLVSTSTHPLVFPQAPCSGR